MIEILIPRDQLNDTEIKMVEDHIDSCVEKNSDLENDYVLVDVIGGSISIKFFNDEWVKAMMKENKVDWREVLLDRMRKQNRYWAKNQNSDN